MIENYIYLLILVGIICGVFAAVGVIIHLIDWIWRRL